MSDSSSSDFLGKPLSRDPSESDSSSTDFLGRPPSHDPSESNGDDNNENAQQPSGSSGNRRPRKPTKPKRRKDDILREIRRLQQSTNLLIPKLSFQRVVREVLQEFKTDFRLQKSTLECLQEATESYMEQFLEDSYLCCKHRSRVTLFPKDLRLTQLLRGPTDPGRN